MKALDFPPCEESVIQEISEAIRRPNLGQINGVANTVSFEYNGWHTTDYLQKNYESFLRRGYYLFSAGKLGPHYTSDPIVGLVNGDRIGLVHTTDVTQIIHLVQCGGKETPTKAIVEYFREVLKTRKVFARTVSKGLMHGWFDLPVENPKEFAKDVARLCPSLTKNVFRGMKGLVSSIEKDPCGFELDWDE